MLKSNSNAAVEFNGEYFIELSPGKFRKAIREPGASSGSYYNWVSCECGGIRKGTAKQCSLCIRKKWDEKNAAATTCKCGKPKNIKSDLCAECFRKSVAVDVSVKTYIECRLDLPSDDFYVKKKSADGSIQNLSSRCRKCSDERKRIQLGSQLHPDSGIAANHHSPANHGGAHLESTMTSQSEIRQLIDQSRQQGAIVRTWHERDDSISRIQVRSGVPGVGPGWMPVIQAAEKLRQFVFAMQGA